MLEYRVRIRCSLRIHQGCSVHLIRFKLPNVATGYMHTPGYQYIGNVRHRVARTPRWAASQPGRKDASYQQEDSQDRLWARLEELEREEVREEEEEEVREEEEEGEREAAPAGGLSNVEAVCTGDSKHLEDSHPLTQRITFQHTRTRDVVEAEDWDSKQVRLLCMV